MRLKGVKFLRRNGKVVKNDKGQIIAKIARKAAVRATGPGSADCEAEIQRLCVDLKWSEAYDLAKRHWMKLNPTMRDHIKRWRPSDVKELARRCGVLL